MIRRHELGFWQGPMSSPRARSRFALEIAQPRTCTPCVVMWDNSQPQASGSYAGITALESGATACALVRVFASGRISGSHRELHLAKWRWADV